MPETAQCCRGSFRVTLRDFVRTKPAERQVKVGGHAQRKHTATDDDDDKRRATPAKCAEMQMVGESRCWGVNAPCFVYAFSCWGNPLEDFLGVLIGLAAWSLGSSFVRIARCQQTPNEYALLRLAHAGRRSFAIRRAFVCDRCRI